METISKKKSTYGALFTLLVVAGVLLGGLQPARAQSPESEIWHFTWTPPTYGSPPVYYKVEVRVDEQDESVTSMDTPDETPAIDITVFYGHDYEVRVAGVDAMDRIGEFSDWSIPDSCELGIPRR